MNNQWSVIFETRGFDRLVQAPELRFAVERLSWRAVGGPWAARVRAFAEDERRLWGLEELLRCGVRVCDETGPAWWGYVNGFTVQAGARAVRLSLAELANRVRVRYRAHHPSERGGQEAFTTWHADAASQARWGTKEQTFDLGEAGSEEAELYAAALLERVKEPAAEPLAAAPAAQGRGETRPCALLDLRGWWETLDWRYYQEPRGWVQHAKGGAGQAFGQLATNQKVAYRVTSGVGSWEATEVWLRLRRFGYATDQVKLELCADNGSNRPGAALRTVTVEGRALADELDWVRFKLPAPLGLADKVYYWLVASRTGAASELAYYVASVDESLSEPGGTLLLWNGSAWTGRAPEPEAQLSYALTGVEETGAQLDHMVAWAAGGQFLSGYRRSVDTGVSGQLYRAGEARVRAEVEKLLRQGTAAGRRLLARVDLERRLWVDEQPAAEGEVWLDLRPDGRIVRKDGRRWMPGAEPAAGAWAGLGELPGRVFLESVVWGSDGLRIGE